MSSDPVPSGEIPPRPATPWGDTVKLTPPSSEKTVPSQPQLPAEAANTPPNARFGKFIRTKRLGAGGMGEVWKAWDTVLGRWVALKFLKGEDENEIARFRREAQTAGNLHHPHIAAIYEVSEDQGRHYIAMQFVDGRTLLQFPKDDRKLLVRLVADAAHALQYAHEQGVIHRDLKPENIMVTTRPAGEGRPEEHHVFLMDFGLARITHGGPRISMTGFAVGTPLYMAPEQARGEAVDARADVFSLGVTLYELLTKRRPFESESVYETLRKVLEEEPPAPRTVDASIPVDLETVVLKCISKDSNGRYATAQAMADDLRAWLRGDPISARRESISMKLIRRVRRHPVAAGSLALLVLGLAASGLFVAAGQQARQVARLAAGIEDSLRSRSWTQARARMAELAALDPESARTFEARLPQAVAESAREAIRGGDLARARGEIEVLATIRDSDAALLRSELRDREAMWLPVARLEAPFANARDILGALKVKAEPEGLALPADARDPVVTLVPGKGRIEVRAEFGGAWRTRSRAGIVLNHTKNGGYVFHLLAGEPAPDGSIVATFAQIPETGRALLQVRRGASLIRSETIPVTGLADATLRLHAKREGDRLSFQVNDQAPVELIDPFPLGRALDGVVALAWPSGAALASFKVSHQSRPVAPSALELGDDLFVDLQVDKALERYREAALSSPAPLVRQEARYKEGVCLLQLKRAEEATSVFEEIAARLIDAKNDDEKRWPLMADCQLLGLYFTGKDGLERATGILDQLSTSGVGLEKLALLLPPETQRMVLDNALSGSVGGNLHRRPEEHLARAEFAVKAAEILESPNRRSDWKHHALMRAHMLLGQDVQAMRVAENMFRRFKYGGEALNDYCWMLRLKGQNDKALESIERGVALDPDHLVERARIRIARKEPDLARTDLEAYIAKPKDFSEHSQACLMLGFLREEQGAPPEEVREIWRRGLLKHWTGKGFEVDLYTPGRAPLGMSMLHHWIAASMLDELTDAEAEQLLAGLIAFAGRDNPVLNRLMRPSMLRATWKTPRAKAVARQLAYRTVPFADAVRFPLYLGWIAFLTEVCFSEPLSAEQDDLLWQVAAEIYAAYTDGTINERYFLPFGAIVQGNPNVPGMGWKEVATTLAKRPRLRGPLAYVFGARYVKKGDAANAAMFYKSALEDAAQDPRLNKLAQSELDRLNR
jgi:tetratricopeptide (TPR) repeat protein/predicted Ser/Thr protein kinase